MDLKTAWQQYGEDGIFNYSILPGLLKRKGEYMEADPRTVIVSRGDFPRDVYFILEGKAAGIREYADGNEYTYFQLDKENGCIGLLELFARKECYIATIVSISKVKMVRMDAAVVYEAVMNDLSLLRRCTLLLAEDLYKRSGNDGILYYFQGIDRVRYFLTGYYETHKGEKAEGMLTVHAEYKEIASSIGVSIRTVGRNLQKLKERQEIGAFKKKVTINEEQYKKMLDKLYL